MSLTAKQIAGNQKRTVRTMIAKLDNMAAAYADIDTYMGDQCQMLIDAAELYLEELELCTKEGGMVPSGDDN